MYDITVTNLVKMAGDRYKQLDAVRKYTSCPYLLATSQAKIDRLNSLVGLIHKKVALLERSTSVSKFLEERDNAFPVMPDYVFVVNRANNIELLIDEVL